MNQDKKIICKTTFKKNVLNSDEALTLFVYLKNNIDWEDGIKSKKGYTRKAKSLDFGESTVIDNAIITALNALTIIDYYISGIYLNYYEDGNMWTPNHTHPGTHQLIISLGDSRVLRVAKKDYLMANGDAIIFGSAIHGVPKDQKIKNSRISIATFMKPISVLPKGVLFVDLEELEIQEILFKKDK